MTREWERLGKDVVEGQSTDYENQLLCIGFSALLHNLGSIRQDRDSVGIPAISTVQRNLESLLALTTWKDYLASKSFQFPELHISQLNDNSALGAIHDYLGLCWARTEEYEAGISDLQEKEKAVIAGKAILAIRASFYKPVSKKLLWTYIHANLPKQWQSDAWLGTIFLSSNSNIINWDWEEIELFEEIIDSCLAASNVSKTGTQNQEGSVIAYAVRERLQEVKRVWQDHYSAFTIEEEGLNFIANFMDEWAGKPEPQLAEYPTRARYIQAKAKWQLSNSEVLPPKPVNPQVVQARDKLVRGL